MFGERRDTEKKLFSVLAANNTIFTQPLLFAK